MDPAQQYSNYLVTQSFRYIVHLPFSWWINRQIYFGTENAITLCQNVFASKIDQDLMSKQFSQYIHKYPTSQSMIATRPGRPRHISSQGLEND